MQSLLYLFVLFPLLLPTANAGYDEEFMMGTLMAYSAYCEEMSNDGLDAFSVYVVQNSGSADNMFNSKAYKAAYNLFSKGAEPVDFRPTACNQYKKALKRKDFYWVFER